MVLVVVLGHVNGLVDGLEHVGAHKLALPEDPEAGAVPLEQVAVLRELAELDLGNLHKRVDFSYWPLEVLD